MTFSNINLSLITVDGKLLQWLNGTGSKKTRMTNHSVTDLMKRFLINIVSIIPDAKFVKIVFTGPSTRFRSKLYSQIRKECRRYKMNILCVEEGFIRSFRGK